VKFEACPTMESLRHKESPDERTPSTKSLRQ